MVGLEYTFNKYHDPHSGTGAFLQNDEFDFEADYEVALDGFIEYHHDILFLEIAADDGLTKSERDDPDDTLRDEEKAEYVSDSGSSSAILNIRASVMEEAILNICLTTFMMAIFAGGSFIISVDTFMLVYPLEYLVVVLKRLSSITANLYEHQNPEDHEGLLHGDLFHEIMSSMTSIFYSGKREELFIKSLDDAGQAAAKQLMGDEDMAPHINQLMGDEDVHINVNGIEE